MRWDDTVAARCRYGDVAVRIFGDAEIIVESSGDDYQGHANILAHMPDGTFVHYEWTYGSCSGCDEWEAQDLSTEQIEAEMRRAMAVLPDAEAAKRYFHLEGEYKEATIPSANSPTNGSIPGMLHRAFGGVGEDFRRFGEALTAWLAAQKGGAQ